MNCCCALIGQSIPPGLLGSLDPWKSSHLGQPGQAWGGHVTREKLDHLDIFDRAAEDATVHCGQGANGTLEELVLCAPKENFAAQVQPPGNCGARDMLRVVDVGGPGDVLVGVSLDNRPKSLSSKNNPTVSIFVESQDIKCLNTMNKANIIQRRSDNPVCCYTPYHALPEASYKLTAPTRFRSYPN